MIRFVGIILLLLSTFGFADEMRPGYLQMVQEENNTFDVLWKVPARGGNERLSLNLNFSDDVSVLQGPLGNFVNGAHVQRWRISHNKQLADAQITIEGLVLTPTEVLLRIEYLDGNVLMHRFTPSAPSYKVEANPGLSQVIATYTGLGIEHILIGIDHLLFVLVLLMLVSGTRRLIITITAFTVAHSITLSLAALQVISIPVPPVEACIALSIAFVAAEIIHSKRGSPGLAERRPWLISFSFGLLHGLGFAAALGQIGLPQSAVPAALLFFNVGVEIGQLIFVAIVLSLMWLANRYRIFNIPQSVRLIPTYVIGSVAMFWVIQRIGAF